METAEHSPVEAEVDPSRPPTHLGPTSDEILAHAFDKVQDLLHHVGSHISTP